MSQTEVQLIKAGSVVAGDLAAEAANIPVHSFCSSSGFTR